MTALRRVRLGRALAYVAAIAISIFILAPIYLITISAFSTTDAVYDYPRQLLPRHASTETMRFFLNSDGVIGSLERSIEVVAITIVLCIVIGTPAGYALARFPFRGGNTFQLSIVSTRAFPLIIIAVPLAVTYLEVGIDDTVYGVALAHVAFTLPLTVLITASVFAGISYELEEAAMTLGCSRAVRVSQGRAAARAARSRSRVDLRLRDVVERGVRRGDPDAPEPDSAGAGAGRARRVAAELSTRRRLLPPGACAPRHLLHPQVPGHDLGAGGPLT